MIVAGIQHDIVWEDPHANFHALAPKIADAAARGARLIVCAETYSTGFSMNTDVTAEPVDGPSARFLVEQARAHGVWLCASLPEREQGGTHPFNRLVLAGPHGEVHRYEKIHLFAYGDEHKHYTPGSQSMTVDVEGVRCTFFVCYDLRFADEFWRKARDTDCYVVVANWPAARREHWTTLLRARAIENQAYVVGVNRVGVGGDGIDYSGDSMIIDPYGIVCAQAGAEPAILVADVDRARVDSVRAEWPFLRDRRELRP